MMSKGNRRVWSRVGSWPSASTSLFLSPSSRSLFRLPRSPYPAVVCATFALFLSLHRMERAESSASNSRTRTSRSLCEYYSALHSRFFWRVMLYHDAPLRLRVKTSIALFLHWLFFYVNSPFLFASTFCPLLYPSCYVDYRKRGIHVH